MGKRGWLAGFTYSAGVSLLIDHNPVTDRILDWWRSVAHLAYLIRGAGGSSALVPPAQLPWAASTTNIASSDSSQGRRTLRPVGGVSVPVPSWLALNGPFDFPVRTGKMLAAERFCRPIEETMDAVANELERIRRSHPRRIPSPPS